MIIERNWANRAKWATHFTIYIRHVSRSAKPWKWDLFSILICYFHIQRLIRFHDLVTSDESRIEIEDSGIFSKAEVSFVLNRRCCLPQSMKVFSHEKRTLVPVLRASHSQWGEFTVRTNRLDFVRDIVRFK